MWILSQPSLLRDFTAPPAFASGSSARTPLHVSSELSGKAAVSAAWVALCERTRPSRLLLHRLLSGRARELKFPAGIDRVQHLCLDVGSVLLECEMLVFGAAQSRAFLRISFDGQSESRRS